MITSARATPLLAPGSPVVEVMINGVMWAVPCSIAHPFYKQLTDMINASTITLLPIGGTLT